MAATVCHVRVALLKKPMHAFYRISQVCRLHSGRALLATGRRTPTNRQYVLRRHNWGFRTQVATFSIWPWSKTEVAADSTAAGGVTNQFIQPLSGGPALTGAVPTSSETLGPHADTLGDAAAQATGYIPEPPAAFPDAAQEILLNALGEPTLASLGLATWYPSGFVQWGLELLHAGVGVPWWGAIVIGTVAVRLCMFPLVISSQKNAANMHNHMPTLQRLMLRINEARASGDLVLMSRLAREYTDIQQRYDIRPWRSFLPLLVQVPVFLSVFRGLGAMTNLPVESMKTGGMLWFKDLTVLDPFYVLPIATALTLLATFELGADSARTASLPPAMKMVMRALPIGVLVITMNFPSAMCFYWLTSNLFSLCQVLFLKVPGVRGYFGLPTFIHHQPATNEKPKKGFVATFKDSNETARVMREMQDRERVNAVNFRQAGLGKVPKTFAYDPTKTPAAASDTKSYESTSKDKTF